MHICAMPLEGTFRSPTVNALPAPHFAVRWMNLLLWRQKYTALNEVPALRTAFCAVSCMSIVLSSRHTAHIPSPPLTTKNQKHQPFEDWCLSCKCLV